MGAVITSHRFSANQRTNVGRPKLMAAAAETREHITRSNLRLQKGFEMTVLLVNAIVLK